MNCWERMLTLLIVAMVLGGRSCGEDWPAFQHDGMRSGITRERLTLPLAAEWTFRPHHRPARGWGEPEATPVYDYGIQRIGKVRDDDAYPVVAVGRSVVFCASAENAVYCLNASTGQVRWTAFTEAPPRFAPSVWQERVYVGADDGVVRCLDLASGRPIWQFRAAPQADRVLGQGRMMSLWPIRTGVLVEGGVAYFAAGLFPAEGLYLYAVDATTGRLVWKNDAWDEGGTANRSPQGYLLADARRLIVPCGRVCPTVFDRETGRLLFDVESGRALVGGSYATLTPKYLYTGTQIIAAYELAHSRADKWGRAVYGWQVFSWFNARRILVDRGTAYLATPTEVLALAEEDLPAAAAEVDGVRKLRWEHRNALGAHQRAQATLSTQPAGSPTAARAQAEMARHQAAVQKVADAEAKAQASLGRICRWRLAEGLDESMILAGETLFAGGSGRVAAIDVRRGAKQEEHSVDGTARGLAVAGGRLLVSTTTGAIRSFSPGNARPSTAASTEGSRSNPPANDPADAAAKAMLREAGASAATGYCLLIGGDASLAAAFARCSPLTVHALHREPQQVAAARRWLAQAGLYGERVVVDEGELASVRYPPYFANLVVDVGSWQGGDVAVTPADVLRVLKPHGGIALLGKCPPQWLAQAGDRSLRVEARDAKVKLVRGELAGAGWWTHQYADPGNSSCSRDSLVHAPLGLLWFGDPGPQGMIDRHAAGPAPLCCNGTLFVQGEDRIQAFDAYNGLALWQRRLEGASRIAMTEQSSNMAATADSLFLVLEDRCLRLDAASGELRQTYPLPAREDGAKRRWGWLAVAGDTLFGSRSESEQPFRNWPETRGHTSEAVFAVDLASGQLRWSYRGQGIPQTALAVGGGMVFLLDSSRTESGQRMMNAVGLDLRTGRSRWTRPLDVTDLVVAPRGGQPNLIAAGDTLLVCGSPSGGDHHLREFQAGHFARRSLIALHAATGEVRWAGGKNYLSRPVVLGERIVAEPWAYELRSGQSVLRRHPLTDEPQPWSMRRGAGGACGAISASADTLFFRSDLGASCDLRSDQGIARRGGQRWSCWINAVAAGGLLLVPEGSAECDCPYTLQCTTVLYPRSDPIHYSQFELEKPLVPVRHAAILLGAPGDVRQEPAAARPSAEQPAGGADAGRSVLWLCCPSRARKHGWATCQLGTESGNGFYFEPQRRAEIRGTDAPWRFVSGARGLTQLAVPLTQPGQRARYTVRLGFAEPDPVAAGQRLFDVVVQGRVVLTGLDVAGEAGGPHRALVKEFRAVEVSGPLKLEFRPSPKAPLRQAILSTIEAICEGLDR